MIFPIREVTYEAKKLKCKKYYSNKKAQSNDPYIFIIELVKFDVFSITPDHKSNKDKCKNDCKNKLSVTKHIYFIFIAANVNQL